MLRDCKPQRFAPAIITLALLVLNMAVQFLRAAPLIGSIVTAALAASVLWLLFEHHRILKSQYDLCAAIRKTAEDIIDKPAAIKSADDIDALETFRTLVQRFTESNDRLKKDMRQRIEELSRSEADLLFLSNALPLGVLLKVLDGPVVFANAHWDQLFAFLKNDNGGKEWECWERWVHPDDVGRMRNIWKTTREQFSKFSGEFRTIINGKPGWMHLRISMLSSSEGGRIIVIAEDITWRMEAEMQLQEAHSLLMQSEKLAGIGQLAAGVAHEINNPVAYILGNTEALNEYFATIKKILSLYNCGRPPEEIASAKHDLDFDYILNDVDGLLTDNIKGLNRVAEIVANLKGFSRTGQTNDLIEADLEENLKSTLMVANNEIKYHADVKLAFGGISHIRCRSGEINQVFLNILVNAAQAIREQGRSDRGLITISTWEDDASAYCSIADDGPGMPAQVRKKIFEPFFTTKPIGKGTGLGLNISWDIIVNRHRGEIIVESEPGKGTRFTIKLPRERKAVA